jgi:hypothetical protein
VAIFRGERVGDCGREMREDGGILGEAECRGALAVEQVGDLHIGAGRGIGDAFELVARE